MCSYCRLFPFFFVSFEQTDASERKVTCPPLEYSSELLDDGDPKEEEPKEAKEKKGEEKEEEEKGREEEKESEEFKSCMLGYTSPTWMPCKWNEKPAGIVAFRSSQIF